MSYFLVFLGAGIGGVFRFLMGPGVQRLAGTWSFPVGTLSVNLLGCLIIGFLAQLAESRGLFTPDMRLFMFVGVLGGFTTFSTFGYETFQLLRDGQYLYAAGNAGLQTVLGVLFVWLGYILGRI